MNRSVEVRLSRRARQDILEIWLYVADSNPPAADRVLDHLQRVFEMLEEHPLIGRERPEVLAGLRSFPVAPWVVFYRFGDNFVDIARIVHGARDLDDLDY